MIFKDYPNWPEDSRFKLELYFMIQLGIHFFSLFEMIVIKRKTELKFYEYVLHHSVAVSLILFSSMSNMITSGALTLIVHDASDILMALTRFYIETARASKLVSNILYMAMTLIWIWMRTVSYTHLTLPTICSV